MMNTIRKSVFLLLTLALLLTMSACGGAAPQAAESAPAPEAPAAAAAAEATEAAAPAPTPEPETKEVTLLAEKTEAGFGIWHKSLVGPVTHSGERITTYHYDEYGNPTGESVSYQSEPLCGWLRDIESGNAEAVLNEGGELVSASRNGGQIKPNKSDEIWNTTETVYFENGIPVRGERIADENGFKVAETTFEYREDGSLFRQIIRTYAYPFYDTIYTFEVPLVRYDEFDEGGRQTVYHIENIHSTKDDGNGGLTVGTIGVMDYRWSFDAAGNPVKMERKWGFTNEAPQTEKEPGYRIVEGTDQWGNERLKAILSLEMQYDAENRMVSAHMFQHGAMDYKGMGGRKPVETDFTYSYDDLGRMTGYETVTDGKTERTEYEYGEDGLLAVARNGKTRTAFTWTETDGGGIEGAASNEDLNVFPDGTSMTFRSDVMQDDLLLTEYEYVLRPSVYSLKPVFVEYVTQYVYETMSVLVAAD
ncbi:MAG: hypothetical protein IJH53_03045 [Oscillospiraceae bacterium]|nr:hypothetical protein [Oscillospiraceae bacterium]